MDVVLLTSNHIESDPTFYRYIGPYKLRHFLSKHGYTCQVIDFIVHFNEEQLLNIVKKFVTTDTYVLGISTTFICNHVYKRKDGTSSAFPEHLENVIKVVKQEFPKLKVILGGYGADKLYMSGLSDASFMSYTSSNEDIFLEYIDHIRKKTLPPLGSLIQNYTDQYQGPSRHKIWYHTPRNVTYNIEADDFKFVPEDIISDKETLPLDVSRGCIFACTFCNYPHLGKKKLDYIRNMELIKNELIYNFENFGVTQYNIIDDTFNDTVYKLDAFYKMTQTLPFKINYAAYIRVDLIHRFREMADLLKESGLQGCVHGIESFNPHASNILGKAWSGKHAKSFLPELYHNIWKKQIAQQINYIIGLPKESKQDIIESIDWVKQNDMYSIHFSPLGVHPEVDSNKRKKFYMHTVPNELGKNPEKYGFKLLENGSWTNETWSSAEVQMALPQIQAYAAALSVKKLNIWQIGNFLNMGYDMNYIINTPLKNYDKVKFRNYRTNKYVTYYERIMEL